MSAGNYIVVFNGNVTSDEITDYAEQVKNAGGVVHTRYDEGAGVINGFAASLPTSFANSLQGNSAIAYIEPDGIVTTQG